MQRISSNLTIFFKVFLPTAWIVFFGLFTIVIWLIETEELPFGGGNYFRIVYTIIFFLFFLIIYFSIMRLKRIDMAQDGLYASNYFKTYRYNYIDIEKINEIDLLLFKLGVVHLKSKGKLGKKLPFIISKVQYEDFIDKNPQLMKHLL